MSTHTHAVNGIPILDFHVHFQPAYGLHGPAEPRQAPPSPAHAKRDASVAETSAKWRRTYDFPDPERTPLLSLEEEAARWISEADDHGVERIVFVTTGGNARGKQLAQLHPDRFTVFASTADPFATDTIDGIEEGLAAGYFRGVKLLAPTLPYRIDDPKGRPFWELLERYNVPVLIHFGHIGSAGGTSFNDKIEPKHLEAVAKNNPGVNFVIPHFGVQYVQQLLFLSWGTPNVYTDTSGSNQWLQWLPYELSLRDVFRKFYETAGPDRLIFGSDSSWFPRGYAYRYLQDQQRIAFELGWPDSDIRKVFGGNAARLLDLDWH